MPSGTVGESAPRSRMLATVLVGVIVVCAVLLVAVDDLSTPWTVGLQVASAVAGAGLGNALRLDQAASVVRNQARPAIRRLFDQATRLGNLVSRIEAHQLSIGEYGNARARLDPARLNDWLGTLSENLRDEINSCATAIDDWGDLAPDVRQTEVDNYKTRSDRMPKSTPETESAS